MAPGNFRSYLFRGLFFIWFILFPVREPLSAQNASVSIDIDAGQVYEGIIDGFLWGSNLTTEAPKAQTTEIPIFVERSQQIGIRLVRWPGGSNADLYDWKRNESRKPGRLVRLEQAVTLPEIARFCKEIGAELTITVNFGTMTPEDAADLVEYCNGPATSEWGSVRASQGFPDPLNVHYFEIGNEENQPNMWYFSWTAENPYKYFFGGEEERRGDAPPSFKNPFGKKGDVFKADGGANQSYYLRFPPVKHVRVFWSASTDSAENELFDEWFPVADIQQQPGNALVFELDSLQGILRFGDGIHGAMPPSGSYFLAEYTTYGHRGFVDFARTMRAVPSSVPIKIGAVTLPFVNGVPIVSEDSLQQIFEQMDFRVAHQYDAKYPYDNYNQRRQFAYTRTRLLDTSALQSLVDSLGVNKIMGVAVTEWNIHLDMDVWQRNRTLEGAVIAAEFFIRILNSNFPVWFAEQFALPGGKLSLIRSQTNYNIAPMGYVFQGFKPWKGNRKVAVAVQSPTALAYDQVLPFINAAAAISAGEDTLLVAITNSAERDTLPCRLTIAGFNYQSGVIKSLEGNSLTANNEVITDKVVLQSTSITAGEADSLVLAPHSVVFLELYRSTPTSIKEVENTSPKDFELAPNYPNPFNPGTTIGFYLPYRSRVKLEIFDINGRKIRTILNSYFPKGSHQVTWNGENDEGVRVASGVYIYRLQTDDFVASRKMLLIQ